MENVGERIKRLRKELNLTQTELAQKLNLECAAISKYETGRVPLTQDSLLKLSEIFDVTTDYLLCKTNDKTYNKSIQIAACMNDDTVDLSNLSDKDKSFVLDLIKKIEEKGD